MKLGATTLALLVAIALAGCGGGHRDSGGYVSRVDAVASRLDSVTNDLYTPTDTSSAAAELTTVSAALRTAAAQLAAITPPAAVAAEHRRLVSAMQDLATGATRLIAKLKSGSLDGAGGALSLRAAARARSAIAAIDAAGYHISFPLLG